MRRAPLALLVLSLALAGCATDQETTPTPDEAAPTPDADTTTDANTPAPVRLAINLVDRPGVGVPPTTMALEPSRLEAPVNARVLLTVTNSGQNPHDLHVDGLDAHTDVLAPGQSAELEFTTGPAGEHPMWCTVGGDGPTGHRTQGMSGTFVVR